MQGHADGQYELGKRYDQGLGVERDARTAVGWYEKAANQVRNGFSKRVYMSQRTQESVFLTHAAHPKSPQKPAYSLTPAVYFYQNIIKKCLCVCVCVCSRIYVRLTNKKKQIQDCLY
jgi:TPR repeat protein